MLRNVTIVNSFCSADGEALLYDCETNSPAGVIRTAEFFIVRNSRIVEIRLVFDATKLRQMMDMQ